VTLRCTDAEGVYCRFQARANHLLKNGLAATGLDDERQLPPAPIADHGIDRDQQLPCDSRQSGLLRVAPANEPFVEGCRGKPKKAALAAVARKLLVAINAMIRDRRPWEPAVVLEPSCC